jgi:serine/threonine protein kinase
LDYRLGRKVGTGSYGQVHLASKRKKESSESSELVAVKVRHLYPEKALKVGKRDKVLTSAFNEVSVWKAIGAHKNCVELLDSFFDDHLSYMVMEKCACSLFQYLISGREVNETIAGKAFSQLLAGLDHMHSLGVMHRDIKPDNFLVGGENADTAKICDFGLSIKVPGTGSLTGIIGTAPYMPPEMLGQQTYDLKADIWSFGAVAYLLLCGDFPYQTPDGSSKMMKKSILKGAPAYCKRAWLSEKATSFLETLLKRNPEERPTAESALKLRYLTNPENEKLPCLRSVLENARESGAFDTSDVICKTETDEVLKKLAKGELGHSTRRSFTEANVNVVLSQHTPAITFVAEDANVSESSSTSVASTRTRSTTCGSSPISSQGSSKGSTPITTPRSM